MKSSLKNNEKKFSNSSESSAFLAFLSLEFMGIWLNLRAYFLNKLLNHKTAVFGTQAPKLGNDGDDGFFSREKSI